MRASHGWTSSRLAESPYFSSFFFISPSVLIMSSDTNSLHSTVASALLSFTKSLESAGYKILHHHFVLSSNHGIFPDAG